MNATVSAPRELRLRALGVEPLRLRSRAAAAEKRGRRELNADSIPSVPGVIRRLALQPDPRELGEPGIGKMYAALTEAVAKSGLRPVRVCDVAGDPGAAVMVFGTARPPDDVPAERVLHADPLALLHADRERKRKLWERMRALGRGETA